MLTSLFENLEKAKQKKGGRPENKKRKKKKKNCTLSHPHLGWSDLLWVAQKELSFVVGFSV